MNIVSIKIHKVDIKSNSVNETNYSSINMDFTKYINDIISDVLKGEKCRRYKFASDTSEMYTLINRSVYDGKFDESVKRSSERLLSEEKKAQAVIARLGVEIQKGILIQTHVEHDGKENFIICKADDTPYIDEVNLKLANGYPLKRKIFKSCFIAFNDDKSILSVNVYDTTSASYWYSDYLELEPFLDDMENTKLTFDTLDNVIFSPMKKVSLNDHWELRNSLITRMKSDTTFDMDEYADEVLRKYIPTSNKINMGKIADKAKELPKKYNLDNTFKLVPKAITAKTKRLVVPLTEDIDLTIKDSIDTTETIVPFLDPKNNTKYVAIKSEVGYDTFFSK